MTLYLDTSSVVKLYVTEAGSDVVRQLVGDAKYNLRGFDSIHLASFAEVFRRAATDDTRFSSFDDRLNQAATKLTRTFERRSRT